MCMTVGSTLVCESDSAVGLCCGTLVSPFSEGGRTTAKINATFFVEAGNAMKCAGVCAIGQANI